MFFYFKGLQITILQPVKETAIYNLQAINASLFAIPVFDSK